MDCAAPPPVVLDCGTGFIKAGLAGSVSPTFVEPTAVGYPKRGGSGATPLGDLDYVIGNAALDPAYAVTYPMKQGLINDWDAMEQLLSATIYKCAARSAPAALPVQGGRAKPRDTLSLPLSPSPARHLRVFPEDHNFILTEPPLNTPENREHTAEIMFETFDVPGLHIGVQAVLALYASFAAAEHTQRAVGRSLTGLVVDSGDGCTHAIPVADGYVIGSSIRSVPLAGRDVSAFVQQLLRERGEPVPAEQSLEVAQRLKEEHCYVCGDMRREYAKWDAQPDKFRRAVGGADLRTGAPFAVDVGYERFLGPELFFNPEIYSSGGWVSLGGSGGGGWRAMLRSPAGVCGPPRSESQSRVVTASALPPRPRRAHHAAALDPGLCHPVLPHRHPARPVRQRRAQRRQHHVSQLREALPARHQAARGRAHPAGGAGRGGERALPPHAALRGVVRRQRAGHEPG